MKKLFLLLIPTIIIVSLSLNAASKKMVFVEEYSSAYCGICGSFAPTFENVSNQYSNDVIPVVIATGNAPGDPFYKHDPDNSSRVGLYLSGTYGTPAVFIDGEKVDYPQYASRLGYATGGNSPITIYPIENRETNGVLKIKTIVQSDEDLTNGEQLFVFIVEEEIYYPNAGSNGQSNFHWMTREILPSSYGGVPLNIKAGGLKAYETQIQIRDEWDMDKIYLVAIVQKASGDKEVLQAAKTLEDLSIIVPEIASDLNRLNFGDVTDLKQQTVTITNTGLDDLEITDIILDQGDGSEFTIESMGSNTLKPGETNEIVIQFFPKENGDYTAQLIIESNADNQSTLKVDITGKASQIVPFGDIAFTETSIDFGDVSDSKTIEWVLENSGTGPLTISSIFIPEIDNEFGVYQILLESTENVVVEVGSSLAIPISFTPIEDNSFYFADLQIESDSKNNSSLTIPIRGKGEGVETAPKITILIDDEEAEVIDFGDLSSADKAEMDLSIKNTGKGTLSITSMALLPDGTLDHLKFSIDSRNSFELSPNQEEIVKLSLNPTESKEYKARLRLVPDGIDPVIIPIRANVDLTSIDDYLVDSGILSVNINPNPVTSSGRLNFTYNSNGTENMKISICDLNGSVITGLFDQNISSGSYSVNINSEQFNNGTYFIVFELMNHNYVHKIQIMN